MAKYGAAWELLQTNLSCSATPYILRIRKHYCHYAVVDCSPFGSSEDAQFARRCRASERANGRANGALSGVERLELVVCLSDGHSDSERRNDGRLHGLESSRLRDSQAWHCGRDWLLVTVLITKPKGVKRYPQLCEWYKQWLLQKCIRRTELGHT